MIALNVVVYTAPQNPSGEHTPKYFKFTSFRPGQMDAMIPLLHCKDAFVRMATGSGKSLCMFLPPLSVSNNSIAVIVSPLNALMDQQVIMIR